MSAVNWTAVGGAFLAGIGAGGLAVRLWIEDDVRKNAAKEIVFVQNTYKSDAEAPAATEEELEGPPDHLAKILETPLAEVEIKDVITGNVVQTVPEQRDGEEPVNPYHKAIAATETPVEVFVGGGINDYGVSYIEEEDYLDDDGRFKGRIDIMMDDHNPIFLMDGVQIEDWDKRVGDSILVDFYKLVPPGKDPVLYVRNHRTEEDYEVVQVSQ